MYNRIIVVGRLTKDPEARYTPSGKLVSTFRVASGRIYADKNGEKKEETLFINVVVWNDRRNIAENVNKYLTKGSLVLVEGRLRIRDYETSDGVSRRAVEIIADNVKFLSTKPRVDEESSSSEEETLDEDIPLD